jgi:uncharacterized protein (TIGR00255 family)
MPENATLKEHHRSHEMPKSMTGYGKSEQADDRWSMAWEIRSVNGKQLALRWKLPPFLFPQQTAWEALVREHAARGRVDISLILNARRAEDLGVALNGPMAGAMLDSLRNLAVDQGVRFEPDLNRLLNISFLWQDTLQEPDPELLSLLSAGLGQALRDWDESRTVEGQATAKDLGSRLQTLRSLHAGIAAKAPLVKEERFAALRERIREILSQEGVALDEGRLLQEIAYLADRLDVSEELARLTSHLDQIESMLDAPSETGRRLDFLLQESFREINTCGNKIQDLEASRLVVDFKVELEKCREQVQNLE